MITEIILREAQMSDVTKLAEIMVCGWTISFSNFLDKETLQKIQNANNIQMFENVISSSTIKIIVATSENGSLLGYAAHSIEHKRAEIISFYVLPEQCRKGIGVAILRYIETNCQTHCTDQIIVWTFEENTIGKNFYIKMGFHNSGVSKVSKFDSLQREVQFVKKL